MRQRKCSAQIFACKVDKVFPPGLQRLERAEGCVDELLGYQRARSLMPSSTFLISNPESENLRGGLGALKHYSLNPDSQTDISKSCFPARGAIQTSLSCLDVVWLSKCLNSVIKSAPRGDFPRENSQQNSIFKWPPLRCPPLL